MIENKPALYKFNLKVRPWARWLLCSWRKHNFSQQILMSNGLTMTTPLPCCARCGLRNPGIVFPGVTSQGLGNDRPHGVISSHDFISSGENKHE